MDQRSHRNGDTSAPRTFKSALILAGAAGKGPFAAGALSVVAAHQNRFDVTCVVGTSSGAINGAVYAAGLRAGKAQEAAALLESMWRDDATWYRIISQKSRQNMVRDALRRFRAEPSRRSVQLRVVATSLEGAFEKIGSAGYTTFEKSYHFSERDLADDRAIDEIARVAVASAAIPIVFAPVRIDGKAYADGGFVDDAPIAWALKRDLAIDHLLIVTSNPRVAPEPRRVGRFSIPPLFDAVFQERLTRDLFEAHSFNEELRRLSRLGVDMPKLREELGWRTLELLEIRPDRKTPGGFVSGFLSRRERLDNLNEGLRVADAALRSWTPLLEDAPLQGAPLSSSSPSRAASAAATANPAAAPPQANPTPPAEVSSKHLRRSSELLLIAPIKQDLVPIGTTLTYASRLRQLFGVLFTLGQAGVELKGVVAGPLANVETLHFVQFAILDGDQRLLLAVTFDGPWESYIRGIVDKAGPLLDILFCHCEGYDGHASVDGYEAFAAWVREHQVECTYFHSASPDLSSDDIRYLAKLETLRAKEDPKDFPAAAATLTLGPLPRLPPTPGRVAATDEDAASFMATLSGLYSLMPNYLVDGSRDMEFFERSSLLQLDALSAPTARPPYARGQLENAWAWYLALATRPKKTALRTRLAIDDEATVQGNILTGYGQMVHGRLLFLQFVDPANGAEFLESFSPTTQNVQNARTAENIGLTFAGLETLGLASLLEEFPKEFRDGMDSRAPMLGDVGPNHPTSWLPPIADGWTPDASASSPPPRVLLSTIDAVVMLQATAEGAVWSDERVAEFRGDPRVRLLAVQRLKRRPPVDGVFREPFGFRDGLSQPVPRASGFSGLRRDEVALGELLLGYPNEDDETQTYSHRRVFKNASFMAMRKFEQKVDAFDAFVEQSVKPYAGHLAGAIGESPADILKGKIMGRLPDGTSLVTKNASNDFDYKSDKAGEKCPFFAHIRRANPREDDTPRIMRRGFSYDEDCGDGPEAKDRGIVFMAYCASLGSQYEQIQKWVNGANSTGTFGGQVDPIFAIPGQAEPTFSFVHPTKGGPADGVCRVGMPTEQLTLLKWGLYLFVPSTEGLDEIAKLVERLNVPMGSCPHAKQPASGDALPDADLKEWRRKLEDPDAVGQAASLWGEIRAGSGYEETPFGLLVAKKADVLEVFRDGRTFSVSQYGWRMNRTLGMLYLGLDDGPAYRQAATIPNRFIGEITRPKAFEATLSIARKSLQTLATLPSAVPGRVAVILLDWIDTVFCQLIGVWFGFPDPDLMQALSSTSTDGLPCSLQDFRLLSSYIFGPQPDEQLAGQAVGRGKAVRSAATEFARRKDVGPRSQKATTLIEVLLESKYGKEDSNRLDAIGRAWSGAVNGFVAPTSVDFVGVLREWMTSSDLWRIQQEFAATVVDPTDLELDETKTKGFLARELIETMQKGPVPDLLHRTLTESREFPAASAGASGCPIHLRRDARIVVSLASAAADQVAESAEGRGERADPAILFGGAHGAPGAPLHACPGKEMALGVLLGAIAAILERKNVRAEGPVTLSWDTL